MADNEDGKKISRVSEISDSDEISLIVMILKSYRERINKLEDRVIHLEAMHAAGGEHP